MDSFWESYNNARYWGAVENQQLLQQMELLAQIRAQREALAAQQAYDREVIRLEEERQRRARELAEAELRRQAEERREREEMRLREQELERQKQLKEERGEIELKLLDPVWRKAMPESTAQGQLVRYNDISTGLGMPTMEKLPEIVEPELSQEELVSNTSLATVLVRHRDQTAKWSDGTGFFISEDGQVLTCAHVVTSDAKPKSKAKPVLEKTWIRMADGTSLEAKIVFANSRWDIALLQVDKKDASCITVSDENPKQGEQVFVFGHPLGDTLGKEIVVTSGIVSAMRLGESAFQLDAAVNPGNSGGPVVDKKGNVVGIAWAQLRDYQSTNFAISALTVQAVLDGGVP